MTDSEFVYVPDKEAKARRGHKTVYRRLLDLGYTCEQIEAESDEFERQYGNREIGLGAVSQPGTDDPLVGIIYTGDFRAEEEYGSAAIVKQLQDPGFNQSERLFVIEKDTDLFFGVEGERAYGRWDESYSFQAVLDNIDEVKRRSLDIHYEGKWTDEYKTIKDLRAELKAVGVSPLPTKKDEALALYREHVRKVQKQKSVGEFHHGDWLIMLPVTPLLRDTLCLLWEARETNSLRLGASGAPFSRTVGFSDERDWTPETVEAARAEAEYQRIQLDKAEPVAAELRANGHLYAIKPRRFSPLDRPEGDYFWINYYRKSGPRNGAAGWYTLEEIRDHLANGWPQR